MVDKKNLAAVHAFLITLVILGFALGLLIGELG